MDTLHFLTTYKAKLAGIAVISNVLFHFFLINSVCILQFITRLFLQVFQVQNTEDIVAVWNASNSCLSLSFMLRFCPSLEIVDTETRLVNKK